MKGLHPKFKEALDRKFAGYRHFHLRVDHEFLREDQAITGQRKAGTVGVGKTLDNKIVLTAVLCSKNDIFDTEFAINETYKRLYSYFRFGHKRRQKVFADIYPFTLSHLVYLIDPTDACGWLHTLSFDYYEALFNRVVKSLQPEKKTESIPV